jgi:hypothetical protein
MLVTLWDSRRAAQAFAVVRRIGMTKNVGNDKNVGNNF